jgi:TolA-binding protein
MNVVPNENCLTEVQLLRYLHDECPPNEEKAIDRHLTRCPMCSDALEGAMLLNTARFERSLKHLDAKIDTHFSEKTPFKVEEKPIMTVVKSPKKRGWLWAAAGLAAVATASVLVLTKPFDPNSVSEIVANTDSLSTSLPTMAQIDTNTQNPVAQVDALKKQSKNSAEDIVSETNTGNLPSNNVVTADNSTVANTENSKISDATTNTPQTENTTANKPKNNNADTEGAIAMQSPTGKAEEAKMKDVADVTKKASREKQVQKPQSAPAPSSVDTYSGASVQNSGYGNPKAKTKQPTDGGLAGYQQAMQSYKRGAYKEAIGELNLVLALQNKGDVYENALWYLADSHLQSGNKKEGRNILQRIVDEKGKFAQKAATLLK